MQAISVAFWRAKAQGQLLLARAIRNNHATGFHDEHDGWTWEDGGDFPDPFGDRRDPFEPGENGVCAEAGGRGVALLEDRADNADEEEEDEVLTNPGLETPNKFGPGLVGCYASQATSASAGGRVRTKQERREQQAQQHERHVRQERHARQEQREERGSKRSRAGGGGGGGGGGGQRLDPQAEQGQQDQQLQTQDPGAGGWGPV